MNIFIIHSGQDLEAVSDIKSHIETTIPDDANILVLENGGPFWKHEAKKLIKMAQMVLFIVGENSHNSANITWELKTAMAYNKFIMYYKLNSDYTINTVLHQKDSFSNKPYIYAFDSKCNLDNITNRILAYTQSEYPIFNKTLAELNKEELLEQYKIFLQTSETLVERRQMVNNFYITVNAAIVTVFTVIFSINTNIFIQAFVSLIISVLAIILDYSWMQILDSYGILNSSKMKIISIIEKQLPASLYDNEWTIMSDKLNSKRYISFTNSEKQVPRLLMIFFSVLAIVSIFLITKNYFFPT